MEYLMALWLARSPGTLDPLSSSFGRLLLLPTHGDDREVNQADAAGSSSSRAKSVRVPQ